MAEAVSPRIGYMTQKVSFVWTQEFVLDPGTQNRLLCLIAVFQNFRSHVDPILVAEGFQQGARPFIRILRQEGFDHRAVTACLLKRTLLGECSHKSLPDGIFPGEAAVVLRPLFRRDFGKNRPFGRRHDHQALRFLGMGVRQGDHHEGVPAERNLGIAVQPVFGRPGQHVAETGGKKGPPLRVRILGEGGIKFRVIVNLERYQGAIYRLSSLIHHLKINSRGPGVMISQIDLGEVRPLHDFLFRPVVFSENSGVHQHAATGRGIEPSQIQNRLRFAGAQKIPLPVRPGLYPSMVVIRMGPTGGVDLASGNSHRPQGRDREGRFFSASTQ